ncbi:MAG: DUF2490 domain-containing protein [Bacteroidota bacterium]|nr:DUF2490 domain-containing protein [Bacteroidota bacterium]
MRYKLAVLFSFLVVFGNAQSPWPVFTRYLAWVGVYGQLNFSERLSVHLDIQARNEYTDGDWFNTLIRSGVTWKTKKKIQLSAGLAYFKLYPNPNSLPPRPEWRPWQEIGKKFEINHHTIYPRFRLEQRFIREYILSGLEDEFTFSCFRSRYRCDYNYTINEPDQRGMIFIAGYEYLLNTKRNGKTLFDQNRVTGGLGYRFSRHLMVQLTYLHLFLRRDAEHFEQHHIVRFSIIMQFSKKEKTESGNAE